MRRNDREVESHEEILGILNKCDVIHLGINTPNYPYVVPMNFGIEAGEKSLTLWLHCAGEGLKLDLIKQNFRVGFEADCSHKLMPGEQACNYTMEYESVIGCGEIHICDDIQSKRRGLKAIMEHYEPEKDFAVPDRAIVSVCVLRLEIRQITGKQLRNHKDTQKDTDGGSGLKEKM